MTDGDHEIQPEIFMSARSLQEYSAMFGLADLDLQKKTLDCAGGASSFTSELSARGGRVLAIDPRYAQGYEAIRDDTMRGVAKASSNVQMSPSHYNWAFIRDREAHFSTRKKAAQTFLVDIHDNPTRYVAGGLPRLPFEDQSFDLVLCSYLLFTYSERLGIAFHLKAITEMYRVCSGEIRIFPLIGYLCDAGSTLNAVLSFLDVRAIEAEMTAVDYGFQKGAETMLRIVRTASGRSDL